MNETLHANIFFFITSVAVVAVTLLLVIILWYVLSIVREVRAIAKNVRKASEGLERDINYLRQEVKNGGDKLVSVFNTAVGFFMGRLAKPTRRPSSRKRSPSETETDESV